MKNVCVKTCNLFYGFDETERGDSAFLYPQPPTPSLPPDTDIKISPENLWLAQLFFRQSASTSNSTDCQEYDVSHIFD